MRSLMSWPKTLAGSWPGRADRTLDPLFERAIAVPRPAGLPHVHLPGASARQVSLRRLRRIELARARQLLPWRLLALLLLGASTAYGLWDGGAVQKMYAQANNGLDAIAVAAGLGAKTILIEGEHHVADSQIAGALDIGPNTVLLAYDTDAAKVRLEKLSWVKHAQVMRLLPSTLQVVIEERTPYAIWQHEGKTYVIDRAGVMLAPAVPDAYPALPIVVGDGAAKNAAALFKTLQGFPGLRKQMLAAIRVGDRRWNLQLKSGLSVMLPDDDVGEALAEFTQIDRQRGLLHRQISTIDLRLADRITVKLQKPEAPGPEAVGPPDLPTASAPVKGNT